MKKMTDEEIKRLNEYLQDMYKANLVGLYAPYLAVKIMKKIVGEQKEEN